MGQIQSHTSRTLHKIEITNQDKINIGRIEISGFFHHFENGILDPRRPGGPDNRRIDHSLMSVSVFVRQGPGEKTDPQPNPQETKEFTQLVEALKADKGLRKSNTELIAVDDFRFQETLTTYLKSKLNWLAEFK